MAKIDFPNARILIVDDEEPNVLLLEAILRRAGYDNVQSTTDARRVLPLFEESEPDLILLDLMMPWMNGFEVMARLEPLIPAGTFLPILILTADATRETKRKALGGEATDFLTKPFDHSEVLLRIRNLLATRWLHLQLRDQNQALEERVRERTSELRQALAELEAAQGQIVQQERLSAFGTMASGVAHDFNNVLSIVLGFGEMLLSEDDLAREDRTHCAKAIITAAQDGTQIVTRLREIYRPAGDEPWEQVDLNQLVEQALALTEPKWKVQAQRQGLVIATKAETQPVPLIKGIAAELREMLTNLIFNAVDAMPEGGSITLRTYAKADRVVVEVTDTGTGMTEEVRKRCLEPFFTTKGERGTGLGLAMAYGIAQRHHATLEIESEVGRGTTFRLSFPVEAKSAPASQSSEGNVARPLKILVVDDDPFISAILVELLTHDCHEALAVHEGQEALEHLGRGTFDLVITDQCMPHMHGGELAMRVKAAAPQTRVILLTGYGEDERPATGAEAIDLVVGKPVTLETLRRAVAEVMVG